MITCPICEREFYQMTTSHIVHHNLTSDQFKEMYPEFKMSSQEYIDKITEKNRIRGEQKRLNNETLYYQNPKRCLICNTILSYHKSNQNIKGYCSRLCSAKTTNHSEETKQKISEGMNRKFQLTGKSLKTKISYCKNCNTEMIGISKLYCSDKCRKEHLLPLWRENGRIHGLKSATKRSLRSKNEIELYSLLSNNYVCTHNEPFFGGWDADIIIHDLKLAILWNGQWHYSQVMSGHHLLQVQNRDIHKLKLIDQFGYKYIIVKDYDNRMSPLKAYTTILDLINKNTFNVTVS